MPSMNLLEDLDQKIELLLQRLQELQRTNEALRGKVREAVSERDALKQRLELATEQVNTILARIPGQNDLFANSPAPAADKDWP